MTEQIQQTREEMINHFATTVESQMLGIVESLFGRKVSLEEMGIPTGTIPKIIEEIYFEIFTEDEIREMIAFNQRFQKRSVMAVKLVEARMQEIANQGSV